MINRYIILTVLLYFLASSTYAGVDQEFGGGTFWWTPYYNKFLSYLGIEKSYALVIGVSQYDDEAFDTLPSEKDAVRIKDYLIKEAGFDSVRLITGDQVNLDKIRALMMDYYPQLITEKDRFLFYWSGHGVTAGSIGRRLGYLPIKNSSSKAFSTMLSMRNLSEWDKHLKARQTLYLLDSCFSGVAASKAMSIHQEQTIERVSRPSRQVFTAGLENQQTIAINDLDGGVFTSALLDGLRGHADTSKGPYKKDGVVTARELEEYVRERVDHERRRVNWPDQITPVLYNFSQYEGDFFFVSDKRVVTSLALIKTPKPIVDGVVVSGVVITPPEPSNVAKYIDHYIDHNDGTISDLETGLMWKKCNEGQNGKNCTGKASMYKWNDAINTFKKIIYAGNDDWRIPTEQELITLIYCSNSILPNEATRDSCGGKNGRANNYQSPTINQKVFPNMANLGVTLSVSPQEHSYRNIWGIDFRTGKKIGLPMHSRGYIRLVRGKFISKAEKRRFEH